MRSNVISSFSIVCLFIFAVCFSYGCSDKKVILKSGQPAPRFALNDMSGNTIRVPEDVKGKIVAIRFWSEGCKSCAIEMPEIEKVYKQYADKGFVVLAVNIGQEKAVVDNFLKGINVSYPVLMDPGTVVTKSYGVIGVPITFILDRQGIIRQKILGETGKAVFEEIVLEHLKK